MSIVALTKNPDTTAGGFYTVAEAARLLGISNTGAIRNWLQGHGKTRKPVIAREYAPIGNVQELSFLDLIEVRFIEYFRRQGFSLQSLRKAAETAREELKVEHPFALSGASFIAQRKDIFLRVAKNERDSKLLNLVTKQYAMYEVLEEVLSKGVTFDPTSGLARRWRPRPQEFGRVIVDPTIAFGRPALETARVPTEAIFELWKAEDGDFAVVADWFEIDQREAREAVEFELALPN